MRQWINLCESEIPDEKLWVNTATGEIELVYDHEDYGSIRDAVQDGYVQGSYSNRTNTINLTASSPRTLCLAIRALLTNHSSLRGMSYRLLTGEDGHLDYDEMMGFRLSGTLPERALTDA